MYLSHSINVVDVMVPFEPTNVSVHPTILARDRNAFLVHVRGSGGPFWRDLHGVYGCNVTDELKRNTSPQWLVLAATGEEKLRKKLRPMRCDGLNTV